MELVLPSNYVEIEEEEMMYLDGGVYLNKQVCLGIAGYFASLALSYAFYQLGNLLWNIGTAVIRKKGVEIGWSWNPFDFGLDYSIR